MKYNKKQNSYEASKMHSAVETMFEWRKWVDEVPYLKFPRSWMVKAIPPFGGAIVRYLISRDGENYVSIYLDCYDVIGFFGEPYWEVYPVDGDVGRCAMKDTDELMKMIKKSLKEISD